MWFAQTRRVATVTARVASRRHAVQSSSPKRRLSSPRDSPLPPEVERELNTPIVFESHPLKVKYGTLALTIGLTVYTVLYVNFGESEHCFTPLRRWVDKQQQLLWTPAPEEVEMLEKIEKDLNLGKGPSNKS
eukprot:m.160772 g.160772  ORF g.160772 m.160772 type:complete len:132 (+) comp11990_c0_seq1:2965-3360(+)